MPKLTDPKIVARAAIDETPYEGFQDDEVIFQRTCPGPNEGVGVRCHGGLLYEPARTCPACNGSGYLIRVEKING